MKCDCGKQLISLKRGLDLYMSSKRKVEVKCSSCEKSYKLRLFPEMNYFVDEE